MNIIDPEVLQRIVIGYLLVASILVFIGSVMVYLMKKGKNKNVKRK